MNEENPHPLTGRIVTVCTIGGVIAGESSYHRVGNVAVDWIELVPLHGKGPQEGDPIWFPTRHIARLEPAIAIEEMIRDNPGNVAFPELPKWELPQRRVPVIA